MSPLDDPLPSSAAPWPFQVADWRRRLAALAGAVRDAGAGEEGWRLWLEVRRRLYATHPASPVPADLRAEATIDAYPYEPSLRVPAAIEPLARDVAGPLPPDVSHAFTPFARVRFALDGAEHALDLLWLESYGNGILLPFADQTNGVATYGGGRYLLDTVKGADVGLRGDGLLLDFNYAYSPSCAWDGAWSCPLPPPANRLPVAVEGGEKAPYGGGRGAAARSAPA